MKRPWFREEYFVEDRTPNKITFNTTYCLSKTKKKTSIKSIKKIYKYIKGDYIGFNEFAEYLKKKYPDKGTPQKGRVVWEFDANDILKEFWDIKEFVPFLDEHGFDDFDRLYYWANKEVNYA